ncbi:hypothetical protein Ddc_16459 [Ditylenchus destructor]|nr:hypothetical protein Ddc_16459 [Ditylenchus destructor]
MRRLTENQAKLENEAQTEPSAKKSRSDKRITNIATLDNDTTVEVFKYLKYCGLAKTSLVSKRFCDLICTHRHKLARVYVDSIVMSEDHVTVDNVTVDNVTEDNVTEDNLTDNLTDIKIFDQALSVEEYNEWVIRNGYSKQVPPETQISRMQSTQNERKAYRLYANVDYYYKDPGPSCNPTKVFDASVELSHENWPVFQHFFRLLTDPFVYIRYLGLPTQSDALNLLAGINPDYGRIQCQSLNVSLKDNIQNHISWIKGHVRCYNFRIMGPINSNFDEEFLDLFMTGANCTSCIHLEFYETVKLITRFVQNFMDLKSGDEDKVVGYIECHPKRNVNMDAFKRDYADFVVEGNINETRGLSCLVFEFVNNDIGKKLKLTIRFRYLDRNVFYAEVFKFVMTDVLCVEIQSRE